jgi:single-strand DNA-binding protein
MNKVILIGNLTRDPELSHPGDNGTACCRFTLAVNRKFAAKDGERKADFINVVAWRERAELCARYLAKGRKAAVTGSLQTRSYDGQDGLKRYITEVIADEVEFLTPNAGAGSTPPPDGTSGQYNGEDDDELPF